MVVNDLTWLYISKDLCISEATTTVKPTAQTSVDHNQDNFDVSGSGSGSDGFDDSNNYYEQPTSGSYSADFNMFQTYQSILGNINRCTRGLKLHLNFLIIIKIYSNLKRSFLNDFIIILFYS